MGGSKKMDIHKYATIFPMMDEKEFNDLKEDIKENGLMDEIIIYEGKVLDGRNRLQACEELGIKPKFKKYEGENPLQFIISTNLKRRHLTESQKAVVGIKYLPYFKEFAKQRQGTRTDIKELIPESEKGEARDKAGAVVGVSGRYIDMAREVIEKNPELQEKIFSGEVTLTSAYTSMKRDEADIPEWLRFIDVWTFKENTGEGISNLPPEIIKNLLYYYTKEGDLIFDPFAGSGQTMAIAKEMGRKCICSDINPKNETIIKWNVDNGFHNFPKNIKETKLIFLDPPYWNMVDYKIGWSTMGFDEFLSKFDVFLNDIKKNFKKGTRVALIIMPVQDGIYYDLGFECSKLFHKNGFNILKRLCVPLIRNWALDSRIKKAKEDKDILSGSLRDLIIFEI